MTFQDYCFKQAKRIWALSDEELTQEWRLYHACVYNTARPSGLDLALFEIADNEIVRRNRKHNNGNSSWYLFADEAEEEA